jgi:[ribosomal protein S18]-alanine N-acetyltransferase
MHATRTPAKRKRTAGRAGLRLRDYEVADFDRLLALDRQCFVPGIAYDEAELSKFIHRRGAFTVVAEDAEGIGGFLVAHMNRTYGWIITIDIAPRARRAGLGARLMQEAETRLRDAGALGVVLEVAVDNAAALAFYKRLGYEITRTLPRYYLDSVDAFQMAKQL